MLLNFPALHLPISTLGFILQPQWRKHILLKLWKAFSTFQDTVSYIELLISHDWKYFLIYLVINSRD
jgi:hypothetical protein